LPPFPSAWHCDEKLGLVISSPTSATASRRPTRKIIAIWTGIAVLLIVLGFAGTSSGGAEPNILYDYSFGIGSIVIYAILIAITFALAAGLGNPTETAGIKTFAWKWVGIAIGLIIVVLIVGQVLEPILHAGEEQGLEPTEWRPDRAGAFALNAVVISTVVPFAEELFFRGVGVPAWLPFGPLTAIVVTAIAFGLGHGLLAALPVLVPFGLAQAWVRWQSGSVWPGAIAHGFYNGTALVVVYLTLAT
jgi:membrane protease YdiL (CAAX protease family)